MRGVALLDHRGWWVAAAHGYAGPTRTPPSGVGPRRAALADVKVQTLTAPPARLNQELEAAFGPESLVVMRPLADHRYQCFASEESVVAQAEACQGVGLIAPYPLAVQAWLTAERRSASEEGVAVVERLGESLLITVCQGPRVLVYRQTEGEAANHGQEIRRTLLGLAAETSGPVTVLAAQDLLPLDLAGFTVEPLPLSCVGLRGLAALDNAAGFVSREAAQARQLAAARARQRRRAAVAAAVAALGAMAWLGGWLAHRETVASQRRLVAEAERLQAEAGRLTPRKLGSVLRPVPLRSVGDMLAALPPEAGLVEATVEPDGAAPRLSLRFKPSSALFRDPRVLEALVRGFQGVAGVEIHHSLQGDGQTAWDIRARLREER